MRVLFVSQEMPPETAWGGIGTYVGVLSEALAQMGAEVHVLSAVEGQSPSRSSVGGVTVHRFPLRRVRGVAPVTGLPDTWRRVAVAAENRRLVRKLSLDPAVIECPEWYAEGLGLAVRPAAPLVVRLHSSARQLFPHTGQGRGRRGLDGKLAARLEDASARRAHVVTSTASNLQEVMGGLGLDPRAVHTIPQPVRLGERAPMPPVAAPRVTFVGRLEPRKGPEIVLRALPAIAAAIPDVRLVFVGRDGVEAGAPSSGDWLQAEARRLGVGDRIELTGQLDAAGVREEMRRATVCAFPSRWESFGLVVAEAAAAGRPVVASAIPPFEELIEDGVSGRIARSEDPRDWAEAIVDVLSNRERAAAMGDVGAERVVRHTDPARVAGLTLEAYENAIRRHRAGQRAAAGRTRGRRR